MIPNKKSKNRFPKETVCVDMYGGEDGIRTHVELPLTVFKTAPL